MKRSLSQPETSRLVFLFYSAGILHQLSDTEYGLLAAMAIRDTTRAEISAAT